MIYVIIAVLIIGGIIAFVIEEKKKQKENLKKFPPGTGKTLKGTEVTVYERLYNPEDLLWKNNIDADNCFYRYEKTSRKVKPGESKSRNDVVVTIELEYWFEEPVPPAKE